MKKFIIFFSFLFAISIANANANNESFLNPIFYQRLTDVVDESIYMLTPKTKFYELPISSECGGYQTVDCTLLENEENFIKIICNDCSNINCTLQKKRINTFQILPFDDKTNRYYVKHRVIDINNNSMLRENLLSTDGVIAIHP